MDIGEYWQENKRFVVTAGGGLLVFLIAFLFLDSAYGSEAKAARGALASTQRDLALERFTVADRDKAEAQHEELLTAYEALRAGVAFEPRPEYRFEDAGSSPSNQYFQRVEELRLDLGRLAGRRRVLLPDGLGIEPIKTLNVDTIERHLEAVDLLDRVLRNAIDAGVRQVTHAKIALDASFGSRSGVNRIERTQVSIKLVGESEAVARFLAGTQSERFGKPLTVHRFDFKSASGKQTEVSGEAVFLAVRVHEPENDEDEE